MLPSTDTNPLLPRLSWQLAIRIKRDNSQPAPPPQTPPASPQLHRYDVELLLDNPASEGMSAPVSGEASFNLVELAKIRVSLDKYGEALAAALFRDQPLRDRYKSALDQATAANVDLRITLFIHPSAPELHALAWELLWDPVSFARLANNQRTPLSRFLYTGESPPIPPIRKDKVRALIAVPNPTDIEASGTQKIDVVRQIELAAAALSGFQVSILYKPHDSAGQNDLAAVLDKCKGKLLPESVTVDNLVGAIASGIDLLYLVCHGHVIVPTAKSDAAHFKSGFGPDLAVATEFQVASPVLWLENDSRVLVSVPGGEFARKLANLGQRPGLRLAVLASCESAGIKDDTSGVSAQAALAPRLAQAGVPAIIAMQGKISMETASGFMESFLAQVARHGSIDRAAAAARGAVGRQPDCWMPALFSRLKNGSLWYEAGFRAGAQYDLEGIADHLASGKCTPFVGWGLAERIYGSKAEISRRLAIEKQVPFAHSRKGELALVSQYLLMSTRSKPTALNHVKESMLKQMLANLDGRLQGEFTSIGDVVNYLYESSKTQTPDPFEKELEALRTVARLPATVFINACPDRLLEHALRAERKDPIIRTPLWKGVPKPEEVAETLDPTVDKPLLLHIFGRFADEDHLVLCEDDYLDYLMGIVVNKELLPNVVRDALTSRALMFLGFNLDDWSFRVLFRVVTKLMAGATDSLKPNVAVQVDPDGSLFAGPEEANDYLQKFYLPSKIEPFWGTSSDFLTELAPKVKISLAKRAKSNAD